MSINVLNLTEYFNIEDDLIVFEIGSNTGFTTQIFLDNFPNIKIYCFEPDPRCIEEFKKTINDSRVTLIEAAVSNFDGSADFYLSSGYRPFRKEKKLHIHSSSIKKPKNHLLTHPWIKFDENIIVPTVRLDTWCEDNSIYGIDFIWADVQGAEEELIKGGIDILNNTKYFLTEYSNKELYEGQITKPEIRGLLPQFKVIKKYSKDVLFRNINLTVKRLNK